MNPYNKEVFALLPTDDTKFTEEHGRSAYNYQHQVEIKTLPAMGTRTVRKEDAYRVSIDDQYMSTHMEFQIPAYRVVEMIDIDTLEIVSAAEIITLKDTIKDLTHTVDLLLSVIREHPEMSLMLKSEKMIRKLKT